MSRRSLLQSGTLATPIEQSQGTLAAFRNSAAALRNKLATNQDCVWTHIGDSTGNATDEWVYLTALALGADYPNQKITYELWNDTNQNYDAATTVQAGSSGATPTPILTDTFTRTAAALTGTAADTGQTWTTGAGAVDGNLYDVSAGAADITHGLDPNASGGIRATARYVIASGTTTGNGRLHLGASGANEVFAEIAILTGPVMRVTIFQRVGGTATTVVASSNITAVTGVTQNCDVVLTMQGTAVTASMTYNGTTVSASGTLSVAGNWAGFAAATNLNISGVAGFKVDSVTVGKNSSGLTPGTLRIINGSKPGAAASYLIPRTQLLSPVAAELITISTSHNHGTQTVAGYYTDLDNLVAGAMVKAPNAGVAICGQNPEFPPNDAATVAAHNLRIAAVRPRCATKGWGYIGAAEKFLIRSDRGQSWVQSADGIHPEPVNGSPAWRDAALAYLRGTAA